MNSKKRKHIIIFLTIIIVLSVSLTACERGESPTYNHLQKQHFVSEGNHNTSDNNSLDNTTTNKTENEDESEYGTVYEHLQHNLN